MVITGAILILSPILLYWLKMTWPVLNYPSEITLKTARKIEGSLVNVKSEEDFLNIMKHGNSWFDQLKMNIAGFFYRYQYLFFVSRIPKVVGMFLIGYALGRSDFYKNIAQHKKTVYIVIAACLLIGLPANFYLARYITYYNSDYFQLKTKGWYQTIFYAFGVAPLAIAYVGTFMLAFQSSAGKKILSVLAPVGKMAFSNYILQSLVGTFVFLGIGFGMFGEVGPVYYSIFGVAVFILQIILSTIWLRFFNYGPLEWLWRSATYKKWQPLQKK